MFPLAQGCQVPERPVSQPLPAPDADVRNHLLCFQSLRLGAHCPQSMLTHSLEGAWHGRHMESFQRPKALSPGCQGNTPHLQCKHNI